MLESRGTEGSPVWLGHSEGGRATRAEAERQEGLEGHGEESVFCSKSNGRPLRGLQ